MDESGQLGPSVDSHLERVLSEYSQRIAAGESVSPTELISQNPAVADALRSHFATAKNAQYETSQDADASVFGTQYVKLASQATIPPRKPATAAALPERFGRYRIVRCLGQGTMGSVYLAEDTQLDRSVALKIPKFADETDGDLIERFDREARAAATLRHPNLCPVYDAGQIDGVRYLSMAYIEGRSLQQVLAENGTPATTDVVAIVLKLAKALAAAHACGVIHRDLKPANIMIDAHGEPIIMDFGLAKRLNKEESGLTQSGLVMGSPTYMSPEQVEGDGEKVGPPSDIYGLGVIFYELLAGRAPFQGSIASVLGQIVTANPKRPSALKPGVDPALEAICLKMIAKRPEDRFSSLREVAGALESYTAGRPTGVRLPTWSRLSKHLARSPEGGAMGRGVVLPRWMIWTAIVLVAIGFGVTWKLFAIVLSRKGDETIVVSPQTKTAISTGEAKVFLNGTELTPDQLKQPIELKVGENKLEIHNGDKVDPYDPTFVDPGDEPSYLVESKEGWQRKWNHRVVAEWVIASGGRIKLEGGTQPIDNAAALPGGRFQIAEIDLSEMTAIPKKNQFKSIGLLKTLKRVVLPKSVSRQQRESLQDALPQCTIETSPT